MDWRCVQMKTTTAILALAVSLCLVAAAADTQHMRWQDDYNRMDLEIRGSIEFTDNDSDVKNISSDGYFRLEHWSGGPSPPYLFRPRSQGVERVFPLAGARHHGDAPPPPSFLPQKPHPHHVF